MIMVIPIRWFKNGSFNGQGTFKSHRRLESYEGEFKSGQADGQGKLTTENKVIYKMENLHKGFLKDEN